MKSTLFALILFIGASCFASSDKNSEPSLEKLSLACENMFTSTSPSSSPASTSQLHQTPLSFAFPSYPKFHPQVVYQPILPVLNQDLSWVLIHNFRLTLDFLRQNKTTLWYKRFSQTLENLSLQEVPHDQIVAFSAALTDLTFQAFKSRTPDHLKFGTEKSIVLWKSLLNFWKKHSLNNSEIALAKYMILQVTKKNFGETNVPLDQYQRAFLFANSSENMDNIFDKNSTYSADPQTYAMQFSVMLEIPSKGTYFLNSPDANFVEDYLYQLSNSWKDLHPAIAEVLIEDAVAFLESFYQSNVFPFLNNTHTPQPMWNVSGGVKYLRFALKDSPNEKFQALSQRLKVLRDLVKESNLRHKANWNDLP